MLCNTCPFHTPSSCLTEDHRMRNLARRENKQFLKFLFYQEAKALEATSYVKHINWTFSFKQQQAAHLCSPALVSISLHLVLPTRSSLCTPNANPGMQTKTGLLTTSEQILPQTTLHSKPQLSTQFLLDLVRGLLTQPSLSKP